MLKGHMELWTEMLGIAVGEGIVVLTKGEFAALEARKPVTMPEEFAPVVCFDGEVWGVSLAGPNPEAHHFITCACEGDARGLHAALEARKPQVDAEVIARTQGALIGWQHVDDFDAEELREHGDALRDATRALLAAIEAAPEVATPDFASMSSDNLSLEEVQALRDWLDERGRRKVAGLVNEGGAWWICALWARDTSGLKIICAEGPSEPAAVLALCQKVAAEEAS